jgi:hypothetical protein
MQPEGTKDIPKEQEEMEPIEKQGLILNVISSLDKSFAKNFISSPVKALGTALQGATKKVMGGTGEGFISEPLIKLGDYLNKTIDELTPQDEEFKGTLIDQVAQAFGQIGSLILTGGLTGAAGKGAALVSQVPKGSAALTAVKTLGSQLASPTAVSAGLSMGQAEFDRAIESGANDDQAFEVFYKNAAVGSVLETIPVMQFFKRFNNSTGGSVANYIKTKGVGGLTGGIEEMTTEVMQQLYSNKTAKDIYNINQDILDGVGTSGGIGFGVGFVLNAMGANAKILRKQGKQKEADVLDNQVKQYEDNIENPKVTSGNKVSAKDIVTQGLEIGTQKAVQNLDRDLANNVITPEQHQEGIAFTEKAAQVVDKIPEIVTGESKVKSVELLVERNDIKQANQNLLQQKQATDEAYHAGIDEEIKANEEKIKKIDSEVYDITKKPSKEFGTKKYEIDGEEVSQEAFEALTGKPIGTKTIVEPAQIGGLKVIKRVEDAGGEAVYEVEGERFLTADGKELAVAKVKIPKVEVKPTEEANYNVIAADYLFTGGKGVILSTDYFLQALTASFPYSSEKINEIRNRYANKFGNIKDDIGTDSYNSAINEIKDEINKTYNNEKASELFDKIVNNSTGFTLSREGNKVSSELEKLNEEFKPTETKEEVKPIEDINKANVTIEGTTDGYKVISGDKTNSIGDIRQEANEARAKGQDTFTKETIKDGKKIFTLTDTTVSDNFGRPGFKSASISFPEGTEVTMEDVMAKLKSELGIEKVKPTEVKSLEEEYDSKNVDELIALKKKLYPSPDIESPMTPDEKLLDRVIAKKFSEKQQEIISKRKAAAEKAPTKELAEGEEVTFNTPQGEKLTGEKIIIPGFEKIDMVLVKEGLNNRIYDLASGGELVDGEFSKENLIQSVIDQFKKKNITQPKIYGLIYKGSNVSAFESKDKVRQINPSSMFESYSEKRKAYDKAEYEKLPLKYTPKEIEELNKLKDKAIKNGLDEVALEIDKRIEERGTGNKVNYYDYFDKTINNIIKEKAKKEAEKNKVPYPKEYIEEFPKVTESYLKTMVNSGYKVDKFAKIPANVKKVMIDGLQLSRDFMNKYGYHPYEQSDNFFTKLLYFMNSVGAREDRESKIIESKKELVSALDDLKKVHEKEFGKKVEAEVKPKEGEIKSYSKKDLKDLEDLIEKQVPGRPESFDGIWVKFKDLENNNIKNVTEGNIINFRDRRYLIDNIYNKNGYEVHLFEVDDDNKVLRKKDIKFKNYNAEDLKKENDILKYDVAYDNNSYPESFVSLYTDIFSMKLGGYENPKIGDVVNVFKKDYVVEGFIENKKNPDKTSVKLLRVDKDGNLLRSQDLPKKEIKAGLAKEFEEEEEVEVEEAEQVTKDDIKKAEAKFSAAEDRFKKARNKIEATQVKQAGMFGGEQKGMFAMGGEEAKKTLEPLRKAAKEAKAELDNVRNRIKVQEVAQPELKPIEKTDLSAKEIRQKESEIAKDYYKTFPIGKIKDGSIFTATKDSYSTFGIEIERQGKQVAPETVSQIKKWAESKGLEYTGTAKEDIRKTINFKLPFKESPYQKAVKEKLEADKKQNRQIGSEKAAATKEIFRKVKQMDVPETEEQIALNYLANGGKISEAVINELAGNVKRAELNMGRREVKTSEVKAKDFVGGNETIDGVVHRLWEEYGQRVSERDIKNALMSEINTHNTRLEAAEAYLEQYNPEYIAEKEEMRLAEQYKEEYLEEQEKLEKELREPLTEQIEGEASEEHINNLIDQYESEIKGEDQQFGPASEGEVNKEASKGKVSEKTQEIELAKDFKEATAKAGKKAKENAKKDFVERNFEDIVQKLKIQIKCPT